jgi:hypothetical protein
MEHSCVSVLVLPAHGTLTTADSAGSVEFFEHIAGALNRYRSGQRTTDSPICRNCGVCLSVVIGTAREHRDREHQRDEEPAGRTSAGRARGLRDRDRRATHRAARAALDAGRRRHLISPLAGRTARSTPHRL